jgi:UDP-N-acetylmuramate dehydrogenase
VRLIDRLNELGTLEGVRGGLTAEAELAPVTWFRVGGAADLLFQPADADDLALFLMRLPVDVPVTVIGLGSNLIVRDGGLEGVVVRLTKRGFGDIEPLGDHRLRVGAAVPDRLVAKAALEAGIGGFAFYHGIPGGIGGALRMNAGANGGETAARLVAVEAVDRDGRRLTIGRAEMGYAYRHCDAPASLVFTHAVFEGVPGDPATIRAEMDAVEAHRSSAQPVKARTGGSTFKNPPGGSAWKLIDAAGMRGFRVGGAHVSELHCNFLINDADATAYDVELLGETVRARVLATAGVRLDWEIKRLGRFRPGEEIAPFLGA